MSRERLKNSWDILERRSNVDFVEDALIKGITKFWYGVMNLVQINILEAYAFLQYSLIVVPVEIESKVMKL